MFAIRIVCVPKLLPNSTSFVHPTSYFIPFCAFAMIVFQVSLVNSVQLFGAGNGLVIALASACTYCTPKLKVNYWTSSGKSSESISVLYSNLTL